jgi:hypothetical protein
MSNAAPDDVVTLVVRHRIKAGAEAQYEAWLRRTVSIAGRYDGHLGVDIIRGHGAGLRLFTCVLRFRDTDSLQRWLDSSERRGLIEEVSPLLADGDQTEINRQSEFWFTPADVASPPPRWKQAAVTFLVILPLSMLVPFFWKPILGRLPALDALLSYLIGNVVITLSIVLLVVYLFMPWATRVFAPWLRAASNPPDVDAKHPSSEVKP